MCYIIGPNVIEIKKNQTHRLSKIAITFIGVTKVRLIDGKGKLFSP